MRGAAPGARRPRCLVKYSYGDIIYGLFVTVFCVFIVVILFCFATIMARQTFFEKEPQIGGAPCLR